MRLQKYMAQCGIASRRKCEEMITAGRVAVNDIEIQKMGVDIQPEVDNITVDGKRIRPEVKKHYIIFNKPSGIVTTVHDQFGRKTIMSYFQDIPERIFPIGRLDYDSEGLLILTNDGELTYRLTHPKNQVKKTYIVKVKGIPTLDQLKIIQNGVILNRIKTAPADVKIMNNNENTSILEIQIHEGRNRQVRRMFELIGYSVINLRRSQIGSLSLGNLQPGEWRYLSDKEVHYLYSL